MHWKTKSRIQNVVSLLPSSASYAAYYWLQRRFGALQKIDPVPRLMAGIEAWKLIEKHGIDPTGKTFFEVGTGRVPATPLAYWLLGAKQVFTIDLNPYVKSELIRESIDFITENEDQIRELFGPLLDENRLADLLRLHRESPVSTESFLQHCHIRYIAPGDAAKTGLEDKCIDFHTSHNVFEHISPDILRAILEEGNRIINEGGMFVHRIDYSDHFSHTDKSISAINLLQYSDADWNRLAGNRYMYMNRLRHDDFLNLLDDSGQDLLFCSTEVDGESVALLKSDAFKLDDKFQSKSKEILSISASWTVSEKRRG